MRENRKTRPLAATGERANTEAGTGWAATSTDNFNTAEPERQTGFIASLLGTGPENGVGLRDLVSLTGWNERAIEKAVNAD